MGQFVQVRVLFTALALAVLTTACGGGGSSGTGNQTSDPPPSGGNPPASTNHAPTISGQPATSSQVGQAYSFTPSATDSDSGDTLTFSVTNMPTWMSFDAASGKLTGTPTANNVGNFPGITISVSDGKGGSASLGAFALGVTAAPTSGTGSAVINWGAPTQNTDGTSLQNLAGYRVLYGRSADDLSQSIQLSNPSVNSTTVPDLASGTWYFSVVSVNSAGTESSRSNVVSVAI